MSILAIGATPGDVERGCTGTLLRHASKQERITMLILTYGDQDAYERALGVREAEKSAESLGVQLMWGGFSVRELMDVYELSEYFQEIIRLLDADTVYSHSIHESDVVKTSVGQAVQSATRQETGGSGICATTRVMGFASSVHTHLTPQVYVDISETIEHKIEALEHYTSRYDTGSDSDPDIVRATAKFWGLQANAAYCEAFETSRFLWDINDTRPTPHVERRRLGIVPDAAEVDAKNLRRITDRLPRRQMPLTGQTPA